MATKKQLLERKRELQKEIRKLKCREYHRKNRDEINRKAREKYAKWSAKAVHPNHPMAKIKLIDYIEAKRAEYLRYVPEERMEDEDVVEVLEFYNKEIDRVCKK